MLRFRAGLAVVVLCAGTTARAQEVTPRAVASKEFQRGVALAKSGDLDAAVEAFQSAYRASPHHAALYNLGQAYIGLGKPVEAVETLERFLKEGDAKIDSERRREVEGLIVRQKERIGFIELAVSPEGVEVFLDGKSIGSGSMPATLALAAGHHVVAARKSSYVPRVETIEVKGRQTVRLSLALEQKLAGSDASAFGQLRIGCDLPAVEVSVDGESKGETPFESPLVLSAGNRDVRFTRTGYRTFETSVAVSNGRLAQVPCMMTADLAGVRPGRLRVSTSEPFSRVTVDGKNYDGSALPPGPHLLRVSRSGFVPWSRLVAVQAGGNHALVAVLEPTADHRAELEAQAQKQRTLAVGFGVAGIVLGGTSVGLFVWNNGRYDDASKDAAGFNASESASIQRVDDLAVTTAVVSAAALVTAGVLWLTAGP